MSETEWITIRTKEAPKEWLEQRRKSIWLPNGNEKQLEQIRRVFRVEVGILYINGRRVRTPRDGEKCKVCGSYNGLYGGFCHKNSCKAEAKRKKICFRNEFGIHKPSENGYVWSHRGKTRYRSSCDLCHQPMEWICDYEQNAHCVLYAKVVLGERGYGLKNEYCFSESLIGQRVNLSGKFRHFILKSFNYRCADCGATKDETTLHIDHIIPISRGGSNHRNNLQVLCKKCNLSKHTDIWEAGK